MTKTDYKARDKFFAEHCECSGFADKYDIVAYKKLSYKDLEYCIEQGWANVNEQQNSCPSIGDIRKFLENNPSFTAHGYIVSPERNDVRVSIEGVECENCECDEIQDFIDLFRTADEFTVDTTGGYCHAWFD